MQSRVAVLGANGFIGSRLVERWHARDHIRVQPVVRDPSALARTARFQIPCRFADAFDSSALMAAFDGCQFVVHAIAGDWRTITETVEPVYRASEKVGAQRIIYLSSASVHGQAPQQGEDERSALSARQPIAYNNAKVRAEQQLIRLRGRGKVEVVILRPGIVYGPRSSWIGGFADELLTNRAYFVNGASGICNAVYIDNLAHAVERALLVPEADREPFLVSDAEHVTWIEFYRPIANAFGINIEDVISVNWDGAALEESDRISNILESSYVQVARPLVPPGLRRALSRRLKGWLEHRSSNSVWDLPTSAPRPTPSLERALLHTCGYKLPISKAVNMLGYAPEVPFKEGMVRSIAWLAFAGYPVSRLAAGEL